METSAVRPEALLGELAGALDRLMSAARVEQVGGDVEERERRLLDVVRSVRVADTLAHRYLIAIAGAQGAGKTLLARELYGLDRTWLADRVARGEQMPIYIVEDEDLSDGEARGYLWEVPLASDSADRSVSRREVDAETWRTITSQSPPANVVGIELSVPPLIFGVTGAGLVLLPGYEDVESPSGSASRSRIERAAWQALMRRTLTASPAVVVAVRQSDLAGSQEALMRDLSEVYGGELNPLVAITHMEDVTDPQRQSELRDRSMSVFRVSEERVFLTGPGDNFSDTWRPGLRKALRSQFALSDSMRRVQLSQLRDLVTGQLKPLLKEMSQKATLSQVADEETRQYTTLVTTLNESERTARTAFEEALSKALRKQQSTALKDLDEFVKNNGGWNGLADTILAWATLRHHEAKREKERQVLDLWNKAGEGDSGIRKTLSGVVSQCQLKVANAALPALIQSEAEDANSPLPVAGGNFVLDGIELPAFVLQDAYFLSGASVAELPGGEVVQSQSPSPGINASVRLMPAIALEALRFSADMAQQVDVKHPEDAASAPESPEQVSSILNAIDANRVLILRAGIALLGADLLVDGKIDSVPALANAVHSFLFGSSAAGGAAAAISGTIAVTVLGGALAAAVIQYGNSEAARSYQRAEAILDGAAETVKSEILAGYDEVMRMVRDRLVARMRDYFHVDAAVFNRLELSKAIADSEQAANAIIRASDVRLQLP